MEDASIRWATLLADYALLRRDLALLDPLDPLTLGGVGAPTGQLEALTRKLGYPLDEDHQALLMASNGWLNWRWDMHILSTDQLGAGQLWERAGYLLHKALKSIDPSVAPLLGELFPIAVSEYDDDVIAVLRTAPAARYGRTVIWYAAGEIERFQDVTDMFAFFRDRLQDDLDRLRS